MRPIDPERVATGKGLLTYFVLTRKNARDKLPRTLTHGGKDMTPCLPFNNNTYKRSTQGSKGGILVCF